MNFLSVCSGIEAASVAWGQLGWKAKGFSEIEPFPCSVLKHHYPDVPNFGDMTKYQDWPNDLSIDLLCGGTPCQSFSVAGLRKGLSDPRGNLMLVFGSIAAKYRPRWLVWENVPGVLSSEGGRDFAAFLGLITGTQVSVPVGGWQSGGIVGGIDSAYGAAYRVLDAQYFGVAQRRRRVFVVGYLGDWRRAAAVLFERNSLSGNPAPSREKGEEVAPTIRSGAANGGKGHGARSGDSKDELIVPVAFGGGNSHPIPIAAALNAGATGRLDFESETFIAHPLPFDTTQVTSVANRSNPRHGDPCHPVTAAGDAPAIAYVIQSSAIRSNPDHGPAGLGVSEGIAYTMDAHPNSQAVAFQSRASATQAMNPNVIAPTLDVCKGEGMAVSQGMTVRRLTPVECERLQAFPDGYTDVKHRSKPAKDGPRYKALGNSWAASNVRWMGKRIEMVDAIR